MNFLLSTQGLLLIVGAGLLRFDTVSSFPLVSVKVSSLCSFLIRGLPYCRSFLSSPTSKPRAERTFLFAEECPEAPTNHAQIFKIGADTTLNQLLSVSPNNHHLQVTGVEAQVVQEIWNWCAHFVVPYNLCPWAPASVRNSKNAISIFLVEKPRSSTEQDNHFERALCTASCMFQRLLVENKGTVDPSHAIAFVVQVPSEFDWDFFSFYDWFLEAEEKMIENGIQGLDDDEVIWAPFHPDWKYAEQGLEDEDPLQIEKQTPFPLVSIVDAAVIDKAGESATAKIGIQNEEILSSKSLQEWKELYNAALARRNDT